MPIQIDTLCLNFYGGADYEHRLVPLTQRAIEKLAEQWPSQLLGNEHFESLTVNPLSLSLTAMSDEQAASQIANAILETLDLERKVQA